jgi:SAM-dependent methyltransferase
MFFPDKPKAFAEARRVLKPGGAFIFNAWDAIEENEFADIVTTALEPMFPSDAPRFLARTPHGYCDCEVVRKDLENAFSRAPEIVTRAERSRAPSPREPALAYCQGTPLRDEIEARRASLDEATDLAAEAIAKKFGRGAVDGKIQAHIITVQN